MTTFGGRTPLPESSAAMGLRVGRPQRMADCTPENLIVDNQNTRNYARFRSLGTAPDLPPTTGACANSGHVS